MKINTLIISNGFVAGKKSPLEEWRVATGAVVT